MHKEKKNYSAPLFFFQVGGQCNRGTLLNTAFTRGEYFLWIGFLSFLFMGSEVPLLLTIDSPPPFFSPSLSSSVVLSKLRSNTVPASFDYVECIFWFVLRSLLILSFTFSFSERSRLRRGQYEKRKKK